MNAATSRRRWHLPRLKQVDQLVALAVLGSVGLVWVTLVGFDALMVFISETGGIKGGYTLAKATTYVLLTVPRRAYEMFGYAALIGGLLGLGGLAGSGELTALRAAGMSKLRICASVALALTMLTVVVVATGETIGPLGDRKAQALKLSASSADITLAKGGSLWARDGDVVINARSGRTRQTEQGREVELSGVRVFEFDAQGRLSAMSVASSAENARGDWSLHDVRRTDFSQDSARSTHNATGTWESNLDPRLLTLSIVRPEYMAVRDLRRNIASLERNKQSAAVYWRAMWARLFYPLNVLVLAFCALPFAFGALRSGGLSKRLFLGMVLAIGFYFLQRAIVSVGEVYDLSPILANLIPPLLLIVAAFTYFRRHA